MKAILTACSCLALAGVAQAATVSSSFSNVLQPTEIHQSGLLDYFNSALGTLTSVQLTFSAGSVTSITLQNNGAVAAELDATTNVKVNFGSTLTPLNTLFANQNPDLFLTVDTGDLTLAPGASQSFNNMSANGSTTWQAQLNSFLNSFAQSGGGQFGLNCDSKSSLSLFGGGGNAKGDQATQAMCGASIVYTYTPATVVPEPGQAALLVAGLSALGLYLRRRRI